MNIHAAIHTLRAGAKWTLETEDYKDLVWLDEEQTKPTEEELQQKLSELEAEFLLLEISRKRSLAYPDFKEYLDGVVKGDQAQIQDYINKCLAVKAKYPK
jgi:hypothetical protein